MADPIFGSKYGPQNGVQSWITFSFLLLGLCLGPVLGSRFGPKSGVSHRRILLLPGEVLQADLRRTSMSVSVNTCFFSLCVPLCFLCSRGPFLAAMLLLVFLDPILGAMMKQVCWHSRRSKAYRGLPEARMAASRLLRMCWSSPWFAAPPPCTFHCFVRKVKKLPIEDIHLALAPNPRVLLGSKSFTWFLCAF